jgi:hypothetical protein
MQREVLTWGLCPNCQLGREVRRELWSAGSVDYLLILLLPFIVVALFGLRFGRSDHPPTAVK